MKDLLIIDNESRFTNDIVSIVKEYDISYDLLSHNCPYKDGYKGIIITGSHDSVYNNGRRCDRQYFECDVPKLGICYGHQLSNDEYNGKVVKAKVAESEKKVLLHIDVENELFKNIPKNNYVGMYHNDEVIKLGDGFISLAHSDDCIYAATYNKEKKIYTVQFHPEDQKYTEYSKVYFSNFFEICNIK